ncbi:MAG TPA: hypothetical protein VL357_05710 [Rariglobus sp.]|jgi:hypothetical protein|nr:hypothetical protein [Rariglobus sp.]
MTITWDQGDRNAETLKARDPERFKDMKVKKADEHERLMDYLMPGAGIRYNSQGKRDDASGLKKISITPLRWLTIMADDGNPWHLHMARWAGIGDCKVDDDARAAFDELIKACEPYKSPEASAADKTFLRDALLAQKAFEHCLELTASVDEHRHLSLFLKKYADGP